jgi:hypothetical protein
MTTTMTTTMNEGIDNDEMELTLPCKFVRSDCLRLTICITFQPTECTLYLTGIVICGANKDCFICSIAFDRTASTLSLSIELA